jgi:hypothetical protein
VADSIDELGAQIAHVAGSRGAAHPVPADLHHRPTAVLLQQVQVGRADLHRAAQFGHELGFGPIVVSEIERHRQYVRKCGMKWMDERRVVQSDNGTEP